MTKNTKMIIRNFIIEAVIYAVVLTAYFTVVLRRLNAPLTDMFHQSLPMYAAAGLLLIIVQSLFLNTLMERITKRLGFDKTDEVEE